MRLYKTILIVLCLFGIILHVGYLLTDQIALYSTQFNPIFYENAYGQSQYVRVDPLQNIPDEYAYALASWKYTHGENPALFNADQPPLGKYIVGWGEIVFGNEKIMAPIFLVLTLAVFFFLVWVVIGNALLAMIATLLFSFEKILLVQAVFAPLLDIFQLFFILLSLLFAVLSTKSRWWLILTMIAIGCVAGTKFFITAIILLLTLLIYYLLPLVLPFRHSGLPAQSSLGEVGSRIFLHLRWSREDPGCAPSRTRRYGAPLARMTKKKKTTHSSVMLNLFQHPLRFPDTVRSEILKRVQDDITKYDNVKNLLFFLVTCPLSLVTLLLIYFPAYFQGYTPRMILGVQNYIYHFHAEKMHFSLINVWQLLLFNRWYVPWEFKVKPSVDWQFTWPLVTVGTLLLLILSFPRRRESFLHLTSTKKRSPIRSGMTEKPDLSKPVTLIMLWVLVYGIFLMFGNVLTRYLLPLLPGLYILTFVLIKKLLIRFEK